MKIAVFGAGAIGGYLAVKLRQAGADVGVVARGSHLAAMRAHGLTLKSDGGTVQVKLPCTDKAEELGPQDYVIITLKANGLPAAAPQIQKLMRPDTTLVTAINGIPYWYFHGQAGPWRDHILKSLDPDGGLWKQLPPRQAVGCVVYPAAEVVEPGVFPGRTGRQQKRAGGSLVPGADQGRPEGAGSQQYPRRDLDEAVGQSRLQPSFGLDRIDTRPPGRPAGAARGGQGHDAGSPSRW